MRLLWSKRAQQDLLEIGRYIARDNRETARRWVRRLTQRALKATEFPMAGRIVPEHSRPDLREFIHRGYRIVYLVGEEEITVLTVFEGHRQIPLDDESDKE